MAIALKCAPALLALGVLSGADGSADPALTFRPIECGRDSLPTTAVRGQLSDNVNPCLIGKGNFGIGTVKPKEKLHVAGNMLLELSNDRRGHRQRRDRDDRAAGGPPRGRGLPRHGHQGVCPRSSDQPCETDSLCVAGRSRSGNVHPWHGTACKRQGSEGAKAKACPWVRFCQMSEKPNEGTVEAIRDFR